MEEELVAAQPISYAEDFTELCTPEQRQRVRGEAAHADRQASYRASVGRPATGLELRDHRPDRPLLTVGEPIERITAGDGMQSDPEPAATVAGIAPGLQVA